MMNVFRMMIVLSLYLITPTFSHGRLINPMTRAGHTGYENDPVGSNTAIIDYVCRHDTPLPPSVVWTAGETITLGFTFGVNHVGFCDGMLSYDWDKPRSEMQWFKIANFLHCADNFTPTQSMSLPEWLPAGRAVFRWSWVALHLWPSAEFYTQCADIMIESESTTDLSSIQKFSVIGLLPSNGNEGVGYANPFGAGVTDRAVGPACAKSYAGNDCDLTKIGTDGHISVGSVSATAEAVTTTSLDTTQVETTQTETSPATTAQETSTTISSECPQGWQGTASNIPDSWCAANCAQDSAWCQSSGYCVCPGTDTTQSGSTTTAEAQTTASSTEIQTTDVPSSTTDQSTTVSTTADISTTSSALSGDAVNLCYFTNWARYRTGSMNVGKDVFEMGFDANLCTHINYGFGTIDPTTLELKAFDPNADHPNGADSQNTLCPDICKPGYVHDWNTGANPCEWPCNPDRVLRGFEGVNVGLKRTNPALKSILSVGGWNFNDCAFTGQSGQGRDSCEIFSNIASTEANSREHARKVIEFLRNWGFDGYDIDWEYPVVAGHNDLSMAATPEDFSNYVRMLRIIREEFESESVSSRKPQLLLTVAVGVGKSTVEQAYDIAGMAEQLDLIGLMTYDLHGTWELQTGFNAPLFATQADEDLFGYPVSVSWAVDYWLDHGARADQLLLGFASYGRGWKLSDTSCTATLCPTNGACEQGVSTKLAGYLASYEIQELIATGAATRHWDDERKVPFIVTDSGDWIGYDDIESFEVKLEFLKSKNLRGAMTWAIDLDDLTSFPLLNTLKNGLKGYRERASTTLEILSSTTTEASSTTTVASSTTMESTTPSSTTESTPLPTTTVASSTTESTMSTTEAQTTTTSSEIQTTVQSTDSESTTTVASSTTMESRQCATGLYLSVSAQATDEWCTSNCKANEDWCLSTTFCVCSDDPRLESSSFSVSVLLPLVIIFTLLL